MAAYFVATTSSVWYPLEYKIWLEVGPMGQQWRFDGTYSYLVGLSSKALAWEFLRRNNEYRAAYRSNASADDAALIAHRWGLASDPDLRADHPSIAGLLSAE